MTLYFTPALLLLVLTCAQVSQSAPVAPKGPLRESCVSDARALLQNITEALTQNKLFIGIDCSKASAELNRMKTPSACAPKESTCSGTVTTQFDQESCLTNIGEDLLYYYEFFATQPDRDSRLAPTVLIRLTEIMENCFRLSLPTQLVSKKAPAEDQSPFDERMSLCKVLKGFHVRSITINRAIAYMNSGEHTK